jgi:hypothetical protein
LRLFQERVVKPHAYSSGLPDFDVIVISGNTSGSTTLGQLWDSTMAKCLCIWSAGGHGNQISASMDAIINPGVLQAAGRRRLFLENEGL